ncbi:hypothetical protein Cgig2_004460 [Carnegiea gigantea]|uniref:Uncharacterized protein n=1 Tax=Carnegiea gigantea TaxID=171969 RepID=A0A9Q1Q756_9CARY|nr:hypothetical protein Cgig2_023594 [Carnegiea gigantea]KAJ8431428.1 hypothetical protein Cgig2_004460 [Carnegiea gigantea]
MGEEDSGEEYLFKIVVIGDSAVGKSNLLSRYARNEFDLNTKATVGVEFQTVCVEINGKEVKAQIWDTAGQERFRAVTSAYYRGALGALIVYDISRRTTFDSVSRWLEELNRSSEDFWKSDGSTSVGNLLLSVLGSLCQQLLPALDSANCMCKAHCDTAVARILVGNKCDLEDIRDVSVEEGKSVAESEGLFFIETSALDSINVKVAFEIAIKEIYNNISRKLLNSDSYKAELSVNRVTLAKDGSDSSCNRLGLSCCSS